MSFPLAGEEITCKVHDAMEVFVHGPCNSTGVNKQMVPFVCVLIEHVL